MTLADFINQFYSGSQKAFAESQNVNPAQVTQWLKKDMIVENNKLYSVRRDLNDPEKMKEITLFLRDFNGIDCRFSVPSVHLSFEDADHTECSVFQFTASIPQDWQLSKSDMGETLLFDDSGVRVDLVCNTNRDGVPKSVSVVTAGKTFKIADIH